MEAHSRIPGRIFAMVALLSAAVALVVVISSARGGNGPSAATSARSAEKQRDLGTSTTSTSSGKRRKGRGSDKLPQNIYVVKSGDTLGGIAEKTGVPVARLQELNPGLDQFQLVAGQRIKLR